MPTFAILCNLTPQGLERALAAGPENPVSDLETAIGDIGGVDSLRVWWTRGPYQVVALVEGVDSDPLSAALLAVGNQGVQITTLPLTESTNIAGVLGQASDIDGHIKGGGTAGVG